MDESDFVYLSLHTTSSFLDVEFYNYVQETVSNALLSGQEKNLLEAELVRVNSDISSMKAQCPLRPL